MPRIMLLVLCLGVLSTVTGCYVEPSPYGTSASGVGYRRSGMGVYQGEPSRKDEGRGAPERARHPYWDWHPSLPHTATGGANTD